MTDAGVKSFTAELENFAVRELAIGAAVWEAFTRVCANEVGVEPRTVVTANQPQAEFSPGRRTAGSHGKRATGRT